MKRVPEEDSNRHDTHWPSNRTMSTLIVKLNLLRSEIRKMEAMTTHNICFMHRRNIMHVCSDASSHLKMIS